MKLKEQQCLECSKSSYRIHLLTALGQIKALIEAEKDLDKLDFKSACIETFESLEKNISLAKMEIQK